MNLKRRIVTLASAALVANLVGPATTALAASGDMRGDGQGVMPLALHDPAHDGGESPGDNADDPGGPGTPGEAEEPPELGGPGDHASDPREHDDSGDDGGDSDGSGPCTAVSNVTVCFDEPR